MINSGSWWPQEGTAHGRASWAALQKPQMPPHHHLPFQMAAHHLPSAQAWILNIASKTSYTPPHPEVLEVPPYNDFCIYPLISVPKALPRGQASTTCHMDSGFSSLNRSPYLVSLSKNTLHMPTKQVVLPHLKLLVPPYFQNKSNLFRHHIKPPWADPRLYFQSLSPPLSLTPHSSSTNYLQFSQQSVPFGTPHLFTCSYPCEKCPRRQLYIFSKFSSDIVVSVMSS